MNITWLDADSRTEAYQFYRQFMPHARLSKKESVAVYYHDRADFPVNRACNTIAAAVRLRPIGAYQVLIGMLVHPAYRKQGLGHQLLQDIDQTLQAAPCFLFSLPELTGFYAQHGFVANDEVPAEIDQLHQRYLNQGKQLVLMRYREKTLTKLQHLG